MFLTRRKVKGCCINQLAGASATNSLIRSLRLERYDRNEKHQSQFAGPIFSEERAFDLYGSKKLPNSAGEGMIFRNSGFLQEKRCRVCGNIPVSGQD